MRRLPRHSPLFGFERTAAISNHEVEEVARIARLFGQEDDITVVSARWAGLSAAAEMNAEEPAATPSWGENSKEIQAKADSMSLKNIWLVAVHAKVKLNTLIFYESVVL